MLEVEVKARIDNIEEIKNKLTKINAKKDKIEYQEDIYFNSPIVDFAKTDEALRIRKTITNNKEKIFITYKGPKLDKKSKTRREIETEIKNQEEFQEIFENLQFKTVRKVKKNRQYYTIENYTISIDEVEGLEPYMEIETILNDNNNYDNELNKIYEIFETLGITNNFETTSYLELLENKD